MSEILQSLLLAFLAALVPVVAVVLKQIGSAVAKGIEAEVDNQTAEAALLRLNDAALTAVMEVWQTTGEAMKAAAADGKLTDEEKAELKAAALSSVKSYLGQKGIDALLVVLGLKNEAELDKVIGTKVEGAIYNVKRANSNRIEPITMAR